MSLLQIAVGWDRREQAAHEIAVASLRRRTRHPLTITPVGRYTMLRYGHRRVEVREGRLWCPISQAPMSTEFAITRFLTPWLYPSGWSLFVDADVLFQADVAELFALADDRYAVMVVQHGDLGGPDVKMDGLLQTRYARKNWSSVMLWNADHPATRAFVASRAIETAPGRDLHAFRAFRDEEIGALPPAWNHLVDVLPAIAEPKILHYTLGGPWFPEYRSCGYADRWLAEAGGLTESMARIG